MCCCYNYNGLDGDTFIALGRDSRLAMTGDGPRLDMATAMVR